MRWGASDVHFVRPVHTVTLLLGDQVVPATILGIHVRSVSSAGTALWASRSSPSTMPTSIRRILLERGKVMADYAERKAKIKADAEDGGA